eukprot:gene2306-31509_t
MLWEAAAPACVTDDAATLHDAARPPSDTSSVHNTVRCRWRHMVPVD